MKRDSTAPAWREPTVDSRVVELVRRVRQVRHLSPSELRVRAKTFPLGPVPVARRTTTEVAISDHSELSEAPVQRRAPVQELSEHEREFMEVFDSLGPVVTAQRLADEFGCSVKSLRWRELHDLQVNGVIESLRGCRGGYRRRT